MAIYRDDAPHVLGAVITLMTLALITFGLRVYVRYGPTWGLEDSVMSVALVSILGQSQDYPLKWNSFLTGASTGTLCGNVNSMHSRRAQRRRSPQNAPRRTRKRRIRDQRADVLLPVRGLLLRNDHPYQAFACVDAYSHSAKSKGIRLVTVGDDDTVLCRQWRRDVVHHISVHACVVSGTTFLSQLFILEAVANKPLDMLGTPPKRDSAFQPRGLLISIM